MNHQASHLNDTDGSCYEAPAIEVVGTVSDLTQGGKTAAGPDTYHGVRVAFSAL